MIKLFTGSLHFPDASVPGRSLRDTHVDSVLSVLAQLAPAFEIGLQQVERRFRHSELEPQPVVDGVEGRRQVEADQDSDLLVVGRPVNYPSSVPGRSGRHHAKSRLVIKTSRTLDQDATSPRARTTVDVALRKIAAT